MDLLKPFRGMVNKLKNNIQEKEQENKDQAKLEAWKKKLNSAMSSHDGFRSKAARFDELYNGTKAIESLNGVKGANARQVVNIVFQLIESQVQIDVPAPRVDALEIDDVNDRKKMIEGILTYMSEGAELARLVSENERIAKKNGHAIFKVSYNPDFATHTFRGKIETSNPHPINIIPQPGINRIEDMDYLFHIENRTIDYLCRMYGEEYRAALQEESAEYGYLEDFTEDSSSTERGRVSIVEAWYKDRDGDVCLLVWSNEVILKDMPKFFYKRDEAGNPIETETLELEEIDPLTQQPILQNIEVKAHVPKRFPFVMWYNVPMEKNFYGKADPEIVYDQQEGIKKLLSIEEEKQIKGTTKILTRRGSGIKDKLTDAVSQIIETDDPTADIKTVELKTPDAGLINLYQIYLQSAKDVLGITEASQGRAENSNLSGRALEMLANNTAGRLSVKQYEKNIAFMELYKLYYDFLLAFYDDKIPYRVKGQNNEFEFGYFDKSKLVKQDVANEFYYPDFDIYIDVDLGLPKDKQFIMQSALQSLQAQAIDSIEYWMILESIGYPNASAILNMEKEKLQQQQMMQQQQMVMQQQQQEQQVADENPEGHMMNQIDSLPPELKDILMKAPPEKQQQIFQKYLATKQ